MTQQRRCVGLIANRDREQIEQLKDEFRRSGVSLVELPANGGLDAAHLARQRLDLVMVKVTTHPSNEGTFQALRRARYRHLNSLDSVKLCQSRRATFAFASARIADVVTPRTFATPGEASRALADGTVVWVRRDAHNIPLAERVVGVARTTGELDDLVHGHEAGTLFLQEFLADAGDTYKAYVVGQHVVVGRRLEDCGRVVIEPVAMPADVTDAIVRVGRAFAMSVYGIDFFYRDGHVVILDVNDFPSFRGVPDASRRIVEFVATNYLA
jgi:ribosomal protein S6--L-glutamate ligase